MKDHITISTVMAIVLGWPVMLHAAPVQWTSAEGGNGHWYERVDVPNGMFWSTARDAAVARTYMATCGYLACITSAAENNFLTQRLLLNAESAPFWIGGYQMPGYAEPAQGWAWITGEPFVYTNWHPGEPNDLYDEDYLQIYGGNPPGVGHWNDEFGNEVIDKYGYVVEYAVPEPATMSLLALGGLALLRRRNS